MIQQERLNVQNRCNICSGNDFVPGGQGRTVRGMLPKCKKCGSLERHRVVYSFYRRIPLSVRRSFHVLQFSLDQSVDPSWFRKFERSVYGGENSLDLMHIDRPSDLYDLVVCNHVLEHVSDDRMALAELLRVTKPEGIVQISVPGPLYQAKTRDWGEPDPKQYYHYRHYGDDILERWTAPLYDAFVLSTVGVDLPTGRKEMVYWISRKESTMMKLKAYLYCQEPCREVEAIYQSWSWKITAPLRACFRLFTNIFAKIA